MKVIKVENFKSNEFYFAVVEDQDNRIDPLEIFAENLTTNTPSHRMANCNRTIIKANLTKVAAAAEVIIQRKTNPGSKVLTKELTPVVAKIAKQEITRDVPVEPEPTKDTAFIKDTKEDKLINNNTKKGTNNV